jgi:outer membrane receptor protein involved in Fe transport
VAQEAGQFGNEAFYLGAMAADDSGWRRSSASKVYQAYGDFSVRSNAASAGISLTVTSDSLNETGAVPVQDDARAAFAIPDTAQDQVYFLQGRGQYDFGDHTILRGMTYLRLTHIATANGEASGFAACAANSLVLCDDDGDPVTTISGSPIPSSVGGDGTNGVETTSTTALGASLEADKTGELFDLTDTLIVGATLDYASTDFDSATVLGNLSFQQGGTTTESVGILLGGPEWNVRLRTVNTDEGLYAENTLMLSPALSVELAGRLNLDRIDLTDRFGNALTGNHFYAGFNPAATISWRVQDGVDTYLKFGQSSRTPTAAELSCANPVQPCLFPLSFISDPDLREVVSRTLEFGAKGKLASGDFALDWSADAYGARNENDIVFVSSGPFVGSGYFKNVGDTQRLGVEAAGNARWRQWDARASFGFVNATYESAFLDQSPFNPAADANGNILVRPGDRLPGIPRSTAKFGIGYRATPSLHVGLDGQWESGAYLRGDEANLQAPLPGYVVFNAEADYAFAQRFDLYLVGENILDHRYATFGLYGDPSGGGAFPQFTNPRFIVPAQPFGIQVGIRAEL